MSRAAVSPRAGGNLVPSACDNDDRATYQLMRRAIRERDDAAWSAIVCRYSRMVHVWVRQHPSVTTDDDDARVNRAFERFWRAIGPDRFDDFESLAKLLAYLKMCAISVVRDDVRATRHQRLVSLDRLLAEDGDFGGAVAADDLEASVDSIMGGRAVWSSIEQTLPNSADRLLMYLSFVACLAPAAIAQRYPQHFPTAHDVYRRKALVLERLRRAPAIKVLNPQTAAYSRS